MNGRLWDILVIATGWRQRQVSPEAVIVNSIATGLERPTGINRSHHFGSRYLASSGYAGQNDARRSELKPGVVVPSILTQTTALDGKLGLHIDLGAFEAPMKEALRRAAIFLGYAFHSSENPPLKSIRLKTPIVLEVGVPEPIRPADRKAYQTEFTQWAIGQGLIEIDQSYQRYVVSALDTLADVDDFLITRSLPVPRKPNLANTWKAHENFYATLGQQSPEYADESGYLRSLGNARNCLAHDSGIVAKRRIVDGNSTMPVRWPGRDMIRIDQNGGRMVLPRDSEYRVRAEDIGSQLSVEEVVREHDYAVGDRVAFSQTDLSEILFFYQILAMKVGSEMHRIVGERLAAANKG